MKVVFRVDASVQMGTGHLMRCLTLAEALRGSGVQTHFICREHIGNLNAMLQRKGMSITVLPPSVDRDLSNCDNNTASLRALQLEDANQTIQALYGVRPDWLVVDHYGLDVEWERRLKSHVGRIMVIDDSAERSHDCDVLLDQNHSVDGMQCYASLASPTCNVLLGPSYALLKEEFQTIRERLTPRSNELNKVLVFFTGGDDQGETLKAMHGIELFGGVERVDVVVGQSNPNNAAIYKKCNKLNWGYHCQVDYMPTLIAQVDLVVGAGGSSNWERCALGIPALVAILAANQVSIAQSLDSAGVVYNLGWCKNLEAKDYANALSTMDHQRLADMSKKALELVDAKGAGRVVDVLLSA